MLQTSLGDRTLGIPYKMLRKIPEAVAVAGGLPKLDAIQATLKSGAITSIITDENVARNLLG